MPAFIRTKTSDEVHGVCDPCCPEIIDFLVALLDQGPTKAPLDLRLESFETTHLRVCKRCSEHAIAWRRKVEERRHKQLVELQRADEVRMEETRQLLIKLNGGA
jgi:hypothetical protein